MIEPFVPYQPTRKPVQKTLEILQEDLKTAQTRRTVRMFSTDPVSRQAIEDALRIAGTAPSGAHRQPWYFVAISNPEFKERLRAAAEIEEKEFYDHKAPQDWLDALKPLGTDFVKTHLTDAPWIIVVFRRDHGIGTSGEKLKNYYMTESVGIAVGFLIQALHRAGLAALTHTPSPMTFLRELCGRPLNEKPFVVIPVGYPAEGCLVPNLGRKPLDEISEFI